MKTEEKTPGFLYLKCHIVGGLHNIVVLIVNGRKFESVRDFFFQVKGKEVKEGKSGAANGHQFVPVSPSGSSPCVACEKSVFGKELLQCSSKH